MTIINLINQFDMIFTTSFKHTSSVLYRIEFSNSNVLEIIEKLNTLKYKVENKINTGKHVGAPIYPGDVELALNTLEKIGDHYKRITGVTTLPESIKTYKMIEYIRDSERIDAKTLAKEVVAEVLNPKKEVKNLTKKEKIKEGADLKSQERKIELLRRQGRM